MVGRVVGWKAQLKAVVKITESTETCHDYILAICSLESDANRSWIKKN